METNNAWLDALTLAATGYPRLSWCLRAGHPWRIEGAFDGDWVDVRPCEDGDGWEWRRGGPGGMSRSGLAESATGSIMRAMEMER